jgi:hypothetical protein
MATEPAIQDLRYLDAAHVEHPTGVLAGATVRTESGQTLGSIQGVLLEPSSRRLRYFVVERPASAGSRRYMMCADNPAILNAEDGTIEVSANASDMQRFDARTVPVFSDEDMITAMFSVPAA